MKEQALVTIGIPIYNEEKHLSATIESALNQSYKNLQIIISDNCSTDSSFDIAKKYAESDDRIKLYRQKNNNGAIENFKYPLSNCKTKYFIWLGGHDILNADFISKAFELIENRKDAVLIYPLSRVINSNGERGELQGSDIDTEGLSKIDGFLKVANNLTYCVALHGLFRTDILKCLPLLKITGTDNLLLFAAVNYGKILKLDHEGIYRREIRRDETEDEALIRYQQYYNLKNSEIMHPYAKMALEYYRFVLKNVNDITLFRKIKLIYQLNKIFHKRFKVTWTEIIKTVFN